MEDLEKFTNFLYGDSSGYVVVNLLALNDKSKMDQTFFSWPEQREAFHKTILEKSSQGDVYIVPALLKAKSTKKLSFKSSRVLWADYDGVQISLPEGFPIPSMVVQSSTEDRNHAYWLSDTITNSKALEDVNKSIAYTTEADISGWDACQLLRPPCTINYKYAEPLEVKLTHFNPTPVGLKDFPLYEMPELPEINLGKLPSLQLLMKGLSPELKKLFEAKVFHPNRSDFLMKAGYLFAENGYEVEQIFVLIQELDKNVGKFTNRSDKQQRYLELVSIAIAKAEGEFSLPVYSPLQILNNVDDLKWLIPGVLHSKGFMILSGAPSVGKTQMALQMGYCLATGEMFLGKEIVESTSVLVVSAEMAAEELKYILQYHVKGYDKIEEWEKNTRMVFPQQESRDYLWNVISQLDPGVVIIDSLTELAEDELSPGESREIVRWALRVKNQLGKAIVLIHHNRKATESNKRPKSLSDLYGSFIFGAKAETVFCLYQDSPKADIEFIGLKTRMDERKSLIVHRTEHLTYALGSKQEQDKKQKGEEKPNVSEQHGNLSPIGKINLGFK